MIFLFITYKGEGSLFKIQKSFLQEKIKVCLILTSQYAQ